MSNRIIPVFSVSAILLSVGVSGYLLNNNRKVNQSLEMEDKVLAPLPSPKVEESAPLPTIEAPKVNEAPKKILPTIKVSKPVLPKVKVANALTAGKPCEMVCENTWQESNYGGSFKRCECK